MASVGLLGGTFNPIHLGHLRLAEEARERFQLDQVWLIPNPAPPHRSRGAELVDGEERYRMACLGAGENPFVEVSRVELEHPGVAYTVETVARLRQAYPQHGFSFITGADALLKNRWRELDRLLGQLDRFIAARRPGFSWMRLQKHLSELQLANHNKVVRLEMPAFEISGTGIRERVREGRSIRYLVPEPVRAYIESRGLYRAAGTARGGGVS